jgi:hypothetical protein
MITGLFVDADPEMCPIISNIFEKYGGVSVFPADRRLLFEPIQAVCIKRGIE